MLKDVTVGAVHIHINLNNIFFNMLKKQNNKDLCYIGKLMCVRI